jgi:hypothetical protein
MCFKFDARCCFGPGPGHEDDYYKPVAKPAQRSGGHQHGAVAHHGNGHRAPHHRQQLPQAAAADGEDHHNDARRGGHGYGFAAGAAYVYPGPEDAVKRQQMARNTTKVVVPDGERHDAAPYIFYHPAHGGDTAAGHRYYPPATAATASIADYGRF